jgi:hypothetical protein
MHSAKVLRDLSRVFATLHKAAGESTGVPVLAHPKIRNLVTPWVTLRGQFSPVSAILRRNG